MSAIPWPEMSSACSRARSAGSASPDRRPACLNAWRQAARAVLVVALSMLGAMFAALPTTVAAGTQRGSSPAVTGASTSSAALPFPKIADRDGDGYRTDKVGGLDCDDTNPLVYPGATEVCNGVDEDCDGQIDDGAGTTWYRDQDGDAWGWAQTWTRACTQPAGYIATAGDCNDLDPAVHPNALELLDGADQDCDGVVDESGSLATYKGQGLESNTPRSLGDLNGDGYDDFVLPATVSGLFLGGPWLSRDFDINRADARLDTSICPGPSYFVALGDVDGDGMDELGFQCTSSSDYAQNYLNIYRGRSRYSEFTLTQVDGSIVSPNASSVITAVARHSGDLDGDGFADVLIGLANDSVRGAGAGRVAAFLGGTVWGQKTSIDAADLWIYGRSGQHFGYALENVGDLDGDGFPEVLVTDYTDLKKQRFHAFVGLGTRTGEWTTDDAGAVLYSDLSATGLRTARVGDLTGDGIDDLVMGDSYTLYLAASDQGSWYLEDLVAPMASVATRKVSYSQPTSGRFFALDLQPAGDVNRDGIDDLLVGAWGGTTSPATASGTVQLVLGVPLARAATGWPGPSAALTACAVSYCLCGSPGSFDGGDDYDGDGFADFVVGGISGLSYVALGY